MGKLWVRRRIMPGISQIRRIIISNSMISLDDDRRHDGDHSDTTTATTTTTTTTTTKHVNDAYVTDAYHSPSIEGYRVTPTLTACVRSGTWNPEAFSAVQKSLGKILKGENPGEVFRPAFVGAFK
jgi:hypothetical protein